VFQPLFEVFPTLQVGELCQLSMRQLQDSFKLIMDVSSRRCRLKTVRFPQVCHIRFCHARRTRAISRTQTELLQPVSGEEGKVHGVLYSLYLITRSCRYRLPHTCSRTETSRKLLLRSQPVLEVAAFLTPLSLIKLIRPLCN
jgi:hypothetical protein